MLTVAGRADAALPFARTRPDGLSSSEGPRAQGPLAMTSPGPLVAHGVALRSARCARSTTRSKPRGRATSCDPMCLDAEFAVRIQERRRSRRSRSSHRIDNGYALAHRSLAICLGPELSQALACARPSAPRLAGNIPGCCRSRRPSPSWVCRDVPGKGAPFRPIRISRRLMAVEGTHRAAAI